MCRPLATWDLASTPFSSFMCWWPSSICHFWIPTLAPSLLVSGTVDGMLDNFDSVGGVVVTTVSVVDAFAIEFVHFLFTLNRFVVAFVHSIPGSVAGTLFFFSISISAFPFSNLSPNFLCTEINYPDRDRPLDSLKFVKRLLIFYVLWKCQLFYPSNITTCNINLFIVDKLKIISRSSLKI